MKKKGNTPINKASKHFQSHILLKKQDYFTKIFRGISSKNL